jgi:transposase
MRELKWITRVPLSIKEARNKILDIKESEWKDSQIKGYRIAMRESEYGGIKQRWMVVESELRKKSSIEQVEKQVKKQLEKAEAALRKLSRQKFACQADAKIAIEKLSKSWKYHQIKEIEYIEKAEYKIAGRPNKLTEPNQIKYQVIGKIKNSESAIETEKIKAGRFILATNILDENELSDEQVLEEYKAQQSNERGFRFLKDSLFFTSSVFVKTPERVEAIAMIMGLCLLVYNLAQRKLRQELAKCDDGIRNQVKKITNKPTMRWVFQMFQAVHLVIINGQKQMNNLTEEREKIVRYLGRSCGKYYLII